MAGTAAARARYSGTVHGVGFRFTARRLAVGLPVTGFVRNLSDGSVELVAEGARESVEELLDAVESAMAGYIAEVAVEWSVPSGKYGDFGIAF